MPTGPRTEILAGSSALPAAYVRTFEARGVRLVNAREVAPVQAVAGHAVTVSQRLSGPRSRPDPARLPRMTTFRPDFVARYTQSASVDY